MTFKRKKKAKKVSLNIKTFKSTIFNLN